jgi:hypothetical protein
MSDEAKIAAAIAALPPDVAVVVKTLIACRNKEWFGKITLHIESGKVIRYNTEQSHLVAKQG